VQPTIVVTSFGYCEGPDAVRGSSPTTPRSSASRTARALWDTTIWLTTHKGRSRPTTTSWASSAIAGDVSVNVDGKVKRAWSQRVYQMMIDNNDQIPSRTSSPS
jgi:hypothetical protein